MDLPAETSGPVNHVEELCRERQDHDGRAALDGRQRLQVSEVEGHGGQAGRRLLQSTRRVHLATKRCSEVTGQQEVTQLRSTPLHKVTSVLLCQSLYFIYNKSRSQNIPCWSLRVRPGVCGGTLVSIVSIFCFGTCSLLGDG